MAQRGISYETIVTWLVPILLSGMLGMLGWMGRSVADINTSLAVAVSKIGDHERRITDLEGQRHGQ